MKVGSCELNILKVTGRVARSRLLGGPSQDLFQVVRATPATYITTDKDDPPRSLLKFVSHAGHLKMVCKLQKEILIFGNYRFAGSEC